LRKAANDLIAAALWVDPKNVDCDSGGLRFQREIAARGHQDEANLEFGPREMLRKVEHLALRATRPKIR
jgi:hypothetical protein